MHLKRDVFPHELTAHMAVYLASEACEVNGEAFSICSGRYARVFVGVADGWIAPDVEAVTPAAFFEQATSRRSTRRGTTRCSIRICGAPTS